jgi:uncharacterized membrane protein YhaH (DUF805 family)
MDRNTLLWTLVAFFGASLAFGLLRQATEDSPAGVTIAVQVGALAIVIAAIVVVVRLLRDRGDGGGG